MPVKGRPVDLSKQVQILHAASDLFLDHGYGTCSIEAIAEKAGVSKVTIYRHFGSKPELFRQAITHRLRQLQADARFPQPYGTPADQLFDFGMALHELVSRPAFVKAERRIAADMRYCPAIGIALLDATWRQFHSRLEALLVGLEKEGFVSITDTGLAAEQLLFLFCGIGDFERRFGQDKDQQRSSMRIDAGIDVFFATYGSPGTAKATRTLESGRSKRF